MGWCDGYNYSIIDSLGSKGYWYVSLDTVWKKGGLTWKVCFTKHE